MASITRYATFAAMADAFIQMVGSDYFDSAVYDNSTIICTKDSTTVFSLTSTVTLLQTVSETTILSGTHLGYSGDWILCKFGDTILICYGQSSYEYPCYQIIVAKTESGDTVLGFWTNETATVLKIADIESSIVLGVSPYAMTLSDRTNNALFARTVKIPVMESADSSSPVRGMYGFYGVPQNKVPLIAINEAPYKIMINGSEYYTTGFLVFNESDT